MVGDDHCLASSRGHGKVFLMILKSTIKTQRPREKRRYAIHGDMCTFRCAHKLTIQVIYLFLDTLPKRVKRAIPGKACFIQFFIKPANRYPVIASMATKLMCVDDLNTIISGLEGDSQQCGIKIGKKLATWIELGAEDYECNLYYFRREYERFKSLGELINAYEAEELQGVDVQDCSIDGTCNIVNMLAAASLSVELGAGSRSTLAAAINERQSLWWRCCDAGYFWLQFKLPWKGEVDPMLCARRNIH